jgi:hypothetical protein
VCRAGCCVAGQHSTARLPRKLGKLGGEEQGEAILPEAERRDELLFLQTYLVRAPCGGSRCPLLCWHTRCSPTAVRPSVHAALSVVRHLYLHSLALSVWSEFVPAKSQPGLASTAVCCTEYSARAQRMAAVGDHRAPSDERTGDHGGCGWRQQRLYRRARQRGRCAGERRSQSAVA